MLFIFIVLSFFFLHQKPLSPVVRRVFLVFNDYVNTPSSHQFLPMITTTMWIRMRELHDITKI